MAFVPELLLLNAPHPHVCDTHPGLPYVHAVAADRPVAYGDRGGFDNKNACQIANISLGIDLVLLSQLRGL